MPRLPYVPIDIQEPAEIVTAMRNRRGGQLNEIDRVLLHAPEFARGFNALFKAVRGELHLDTFLRELVICGVGYLNNADFEVVNHLPILEQAGASAAQIKALKDYRSAADNKDLFDETMRAVMKLTIESTDKVQVSDATFKTAAAALGDHRSMVEILGVISAYNMASRMLVALDVH